MEKLTKTQKNELKKNLGSIEEVLNDREDWEWENGCYEYRFLVGKNYIKFIVLDNDEIFFDLCIDFENLEGIDVKSILQLLIRYLYQVEINWRDKFVRKTANSYKTKAKSIVLWSSRGNYNRVNKINNEIVERYKITEKYKKEIEEYKEIVRDLYNALNKLVKDWKVEDISVYCKEKFQKFNVKDIELSIEDNKIIATYIGECRSYNLSVDIDSFSRNENVFRELFSKVKVLEELEAVC